MNKKTGKPINLSKTYSGFSVRFNEGRKQPFTVWCGDESIAFTDTLQGAEKIIEADINENRVKSRTRK